MRHIDIEATIEDIRLVGTRLARAETRLAPHVLSLEDVNDALGELHDAEKELMDLRENLRERQIYAIARALS